MKIETHFAVGEVDPTQLAGATAIVIDVIRASSTIVEALASGARAVYPVASSEEALRLANSLGREDSLLCGERGGLKIEGFDLGNSPLEFTSDRVGGKRLLMTTTNGTRAFMAAERAERILAASLLNLSAVGLAVGRCERVVFVCAGKEDRFAFDDAFCAGMIIQRLVEPPDGVQAGARVLDDASRAALALAGSHEASPSLLRDTAAGAALVGVGLEADLDRCAEVDRYSLVPEMCDRMIRLPD